MARMHEGPDSVGDSPRAVNRVDYVATADELAVTTNMLESQLLVEQLDDPERPRRADRNHHSAQTDHRNPIERVPTRKSVYLSAAFQSSQYTSWVSNADMAMDPGKVIPTALRIVCKARLLVVLLSFAHHHFDLIKILKKKGSDAIITSFALPTTNHRWQAAIGKLVMSQKSWAIDVDNLDGSAVKDASGGCCSASPWRRAQSISRRCVYRVRLEDKPTYINFVCPVLIDLPARVIRSIGRDVAASVTSFSETLPPLCQIRLGDEQGLQYYTSKLRLITVNSMGCSPKRNVVVGGRLEGGFS